MEIYLQEQGSHQSDCFDGKRRRSGGSELSRRFAEARRSGACADETKYGTILPGKNQRFLLGVSIILFFALRGEKSEGKAPLNSPEELQD
jgi:hypothetical protein